MKRRTFVKSGIVLGGMAFLGSSLFSKLAAGAIKEDIFSISGDDPLKGIPDLLNALGGIEQFVRSGNSVGVLVNSPWKERGFYTDPDVALSVIRLCKDAGAGKIICYKPVRDGYWESSRYFNEMESIIREIEYGEERMTLTIPDGQELKSAEVFRVFTETDVFINIPVAKHHNGTLYSGTLKGLMGVSSGTTNRFMHSPDGEYTSSKQDYLAQCIADLNLIRQPDICIVDAIECALENGPRGPGKTIRPNRILASTDVVAIDVYASTLMGINPADISTFKYAGNHNLGKSNIEEITVKAF
ncbi:MAG: DUF362 domain-containing protein [Bacteroidetes bacterium]|nr:DUF362 domain-containing protein [Bacteroidota bacterium]